MYCSPLISYDVGGADPMYGSSWDHNSIPFSELKALINKDS